MPDQLEGIVQRMIDAGESEDNIASVIKEYRPPQPTGHGTSAMLGAPSEPYAEGVNPADRWQNKAAAGLEPLAHPKTAGDFAGLLIPSGVEGAIGAIKGYISAGSRAMEGATSLKSIPGRMLKTLYQDATAPAPVRGLARYAPNISSGGQNVFAEGAAAVDGAPIVDRYMANSGAPVPTASQGGHIVGHVPESVPSSGAPLQTERVPYGVPSAGAATGALSDVDRLKAAGVQDWQIAALQKNPQALAQALAGLK